MPAPIPDHTRQAILDDAQTGTKSRNAIAREYNVSVSTVTRIVQHAGMTDAFDRSATKRATEARQVDLAARRMELKALLLDDAFWMREKARGTSTITAFDPKAGEIVTRDVAAQSSDVRNYYDSLGIAVDKFAALDRLDADGGVDEATSMLGQLADGLQAAYRHRHKGDSDQQEP